VAVANYRESHNQEYPPAFVLGPDGRPWHSWRVLLLPYIGFEEIHKRYRFDEPWDGPHNRTLADQTPSTYTFPSTKKAGKHVANYLAVVGKQTLWPGARPYKGNPPDESSSTILLVENDGLDIPWMEPRDLSFDGMSFELQRPNGVSSPYKRPGAAMADGSVCSLGPGLSHDALRALLTADGGEHVVGGGGDWRVIDDGRTRELLHAP
jgi:hypothetical protein